MELNWVECPCCGRELEVEKVVPCTVFGVLLGHTQLVPDHLTRQMRVCLGGGALVFRPAQSRRERRCLTCS